MQRKRESPRHIHVLSQLVLPARFEGLRSKVGDEVARLLVEPEKPTARAFERAGRAVRARHEGLFLPLHARSGTGKTTLASSLSVFFPRLFAPTYAYEGPVQFDHLQKAASDAIGRLAPNDDRILPVNIDQRESDPPTASELAVIKRFLRTSGIGNRSVVLWPETNSDIADQISNAFKEIAGEPPVNLPVEIQGPPQEAWQQITLNTLEVVNELASIEDLGVDPRNYDPTNYRSIGEFIGKIAADFTRILSELIEATDRPINLCVIFVSQSADAGVLPQLTTPAHYGLLDGKALLDATSASGIGRWWTGHRGLLTQSILRLDAHAFCLPPSTAVSILSRFGPATAIEDLRSLGISAAGPTKIARDIGRSDLGKYLSGIERSTFEARGTPATTATPAFQLLGENGFTYGKDKKLNKSLLEGLEEYCRAEDLPLEKSVCESRLEFCPLVPDNALYLPEHVLCLEYTWRNSEFLQSRHRAEVAKYILAKIRAYATELGWVPADA